MYLTDSSQRAARIKRTEEFTVTMPPSSKMLGCEPERTARRVRAKATVDKVNVMTAPSRIPFLFLVTSIFNAVVDEEWMLTMLLKISMSVGSMPFEEKEASYICIYVQVDVSFQESMIDRGPFILAMRASSWSQNLRVRRESFYGRCCKW
jgi:hypothetical protein